jgi:hypothetical protein
MDKKIAFLGGGNMAEALIKGMLSADVAKSRQMAVTDASPARLDYLKKYNIDPAKSNRDAVQQAEIVLLCVKPQVMDVVLAEIASVADSSKLVISIAAGITISRLEQALAANPRVIRVMPNTPALVLSGAAAWGKQSDERGHGAGADLSAVAELSLLTKIDGCGDRLPEADLPLCSRSSRPCPMQAWKAPPSVRAELAVQTVSARRRWCSNQRASRQTQGHGDLTGRHDHRRHARAGKGKASGRADERCGSGDQQEQGARRQSGEHAAYTGRRQKDCAQGCKKRHEETIRYLPADF